MTPAKAAAGAVKPPSSAKTPIAAPDQTAVLDSSARHGSRRHWRSSFMMTAPVGVAGRTPPPATSRVERGRSRLRCDRCSRGTRRGMDASDGHRVDDDQCGEQEHRARGQSPAPIAVHREDAP